MILHLSLFKACLMLAGTTILVFPQAKADVCNERREPSESDLFKVEVPNALNSTFRFNFDSGNKATIEVKNGTHDAGLSQADDCDKKPVTKIYGYAAEREDATWPGKTFEVTKTVPHQVTWVNKIAPGPYILTGAKNSVGDFSSYSVVDESLHWAYSLGGNSKCSGICDCGNPTFDTCGVPIVTHLHGGQTDFKNDGNPEFFFGSQVIKKLPLIRGPEYNTNIYRYANNLDATSIWYHDHSLGITRLNVYAGLAGFYFVRDTYDTGKEGTGLAGEPVNLPAGEYEVALAIQDRFFKKNGEFLYPAFPGDPGYADFITCRGVNLIPDQTPPFTVADKKQCANVPGCNDIPDESFTCGPTALTEFFGDHMVVNGKIWPKMDVEPRHYRLRLLNGCDSRFLQLQFCTAEGAGVDCDQGNLIPFYVIGGDQGFAPKATEVEETLLMETGSRYDIILDFTGLANTRVIMKNIGGDKPFGGTIGGDDVFVFDYTDRIMAFDVRATSNGPVDNFDLDALNEKLDIIAAARTPLGQPDYIRKVALFEGTDEFGRLQPLLGTVVPAETWQGRIINWPNEQVYRDANLIGPMQGTMTWHEPITENPQLNSVEVWEIWNFSPDAHPIHLHLVKFKVLGRQNITYVSNADPNSHVIGDTEQPEGDGVYLVPQNTTQHNGAVGKGFKVVLKNYTYGNSFNLDEPYVENHFKDIVTALPDQITLIKMEFTKFGRYVWHCHILSHEDHEMMRVMFVGGNPSGTSGRNLRGNAENEDEA